MVGKNNSDSVTILDELISYSKNHKRGKEASLFIEFLRHYYGSVSLTDLSEHSIPDLFSIANKHWHLMEDRKPGEVRVTIFNPEQERDGWSSPHTVIQISYDDIPFLVDSVRMVVNQYDVQIHFINHFSGLKLKREKGHITEIIAANHDKKVKSEAPIHIEIDRIEDQDIINKMHAQFLDVFHDVTAAVDDWRKMVERVEDSLKELDITPPPVDQDELVESRDFLRWLVNNNFTFLGARDYKLIGNGTNRALQIIPGTGLGVLRDETYSTASKMYAELPPQARKMALSKNILIIAKTNTTSTVHRQVHTDYIGVKRFNAAGELIGERRFIGLYTSTAYHSSPRHIPFLRHKVDQVLELLDYPPDSHDGKEAVHILETLPRDDLFQASVEELLTLTKDILHLKERKRIRLLIRRDAYYRYFSCLVYVPREIFNTDVAVAMQEILVNKLRGLESTYTTYFSDSILARIHFLIRVNPKAPIDYDVYALEKQLIDVTRSWFDDLKDQLILRHAEAKGLALFKKYAKAIPSSYTEHYSTNDAISDIHHIERVLTGLPLDMYLHQSEDTNRLSLKLFHVDQPVILSDVLPIFENMGLKIISELPHEFKHADGKRVWMHDFNMTYATNKKMNINDIKTIFQDAFTKIWLGEIENDGFNRLVLEANLTHQESTVLRAYTKYLKQIGSTFSQSYIERALINNAELSRSLIQLFSLRFDPAYSDQERESITELVSYIEQSLEAVVSLDEDRIIRRLLELMLATSRTNYYQASAEGTSKPYLSFKFEPEHISDIPLPRPKYEIFVYSPRVEGVHLRAGKVARGGLRWSDRFEDFRTEVLGLMKAQQVKNTVIVPEGAKGGFVVKLPFSADIPRDEYMKEVIHCYSTFIQGLLDITDNIVDGKIVPPQSVIRHDDDDPYLVVAADKGTATFSDIANSIATRYGFWLGDAFASGGSLGYDHKKMGITSRGVWVSVKRNFQELDINPDLDDITVVGIGDMSGDVFGNGMLMSRHIKLVAAYNHMHIFVDPNPNPEASYEERKRLFHLPRSTWKDYNPELISQGGGVFERSSKSIKLTPEIKQLLGIKKDSLVPSELIKAILRAPVDLIWNGGIGTFVKSSNESHLDVGDRTNDILRIDANELQAKTIAEGGNLGMTQKARIEYALEGGIVNTDFIDNSAGVDCSDHEVNIKILLNKLVADGDMSFEARNTLLEKMTDEVAKLVLQDNYDQTLMLSLETSVAQQTLDLFRQYMNELERTGRLDRKLEYLPSDEAILERKANNKPLSRPEIAILLAYSKMYLKRDLLNCQLIDDPFFDKYLMAAFPKMLSDKYFDKIKEHSLRREIISTQLTKDITDRMGINFVERLHRETGASIDFIVKAYTIAESIFHMDKLWASIKSLDNKVNQTIQYRMILQVYYLVRRSTRWFLRNRKPSIDIMKTIEEFLPKVESIVKKIDSLLDDVDHQSYHMTINYLVEQQVPEKIAKQIATCNILFTSLDIVESSRKYSLDLFDVAKTYYQLGNKLELNWLRELMGNCAVENQWDELARAGFRDDLDRVQRKLSARVLSLKSKEVAQKSISDKLSHWINKHQFLLSRWNKLLSDIKSSEAVDFVTYSVVLRELFEFAQAS